MLVINGLDITTLSELRASADRNGRGLEAEIAFIIASHLRAVSASEGSTSMVGPDAQLGGVTAESRGNIGPMKSGLRMLLDVSCGSRSSRSN